MDEKVRNSNNKPFYQRLWFIVFTVFLIIMVSLWFVIQFIYPTTSPINSISYFIYSIEHPHQKMGKQTIAFLPYWRLSDTKYTRFDLLSEINYFALTIDGSGDFEKVINNQTEPGWLHWNSQTVKDLIAKTQITGGAFALTIASQKNKTIEKLLNSKKSQQNLINNILFQVSSRHLNGITLDFEYDGMPDKKYIQAFTSFSSNLSSSLRQKSPHVKLGLTLLPLSGREKGLFDLPKLLPYFDTFIGMSYDYYALGSDIAGPVAPMQGFSEHKFFFDVTTTYQDYLKFIPKEKIVMGIPYYGYDWAVKDGKKIQSATLPQSDPNSYAAVLSYARMREDHDLKQNQCQWDDYAKEHWCWYKDSNNIDHQVWVEDNKSILAKYAFAIKKQFAGVAIWTLGYDTNYPDLWNIMAKSFGQK